MCNVKRLLNLEGFLIYLFCIRTYDKQWELKKKQTPQCKGSVMHLHTAVQTHYCSVHVQVAVMVFTLMTKI